MAVASALLALALLAPVQEEVVLKRTFEKSAEWKHRGQMLLTMDVGQLQMDFDLDEKVEALFEGGAQADFKRRVSNFKVAFNGNEVEPGGPMAPKQLEWTNRLDQRGLAVAQPNEKKDIFGSLFSAILFASMLPNAPVKIGSPYTAEFEASGAKVKAKAVLAEIKAGVARIQCEIDWKGDGQGVMKQGKAIATNWVEVKTGAPMKIEGTVSGMESPAGVGLKDISFQLERKKS